MDRLPVEDGDPAQLWVQLDIGNAQESQCMFSMRTDRRIVVQFQWMSAPYDTEGARGRLWAALSESPV